MVDQERAELRQGPEPQRDDRFTPQEVSELLTKLAANEYNLSVSTYVEQEGTREVVDIEKLNAELREIVARENSLRAEIDKIIEEIG